MVITKLELCNFGIHRSLIFEPGPVPVVGLLGPNGAGKSTILNAIRFAFTGEFPSTKDTLDNTVTIGQDKGYVVVEFIKDGRHGTIRRDVGRAPKRSLVWDGAKPITSAKGVETKIIEILGADKHALGHACFLRQGMLNELLFGTETDREKLAIKLVNLSFCEKHKDKIDGRLNSYASQIGDFSTLMDEQKQRLGEAKQVCAELTEELRNVTDHGPTIATLEKIQENDRDLVRLEQEIGQHGNGMAVYQSTIQQILVARNAESAEALKAVIDATDELFLKKNEIVSNHDAQLQRVKSYHQAMDDFQYHGEKAREFKKQQEDLGHQLGSMTSPAPPSEEERKAAQDIQFETQQLQKWLDVQQQMAGGEVPETCGSCGLKLDCTNCVDTEAISDLERRIGEKTNEHILALQKIRDKEAAIDRHEETVRQLQNECTSFGNSANVAQSKVQAAQGILVSHRDVAHLSPESMEDISTVRAELEHLREHLELLREDYNKLTQALASQAQLQKTINDAEKAQQEKEASNQSLRETIPDGTLPLEQLVQLQQQRNELSGRLTQATTHMDTLQAAVNETQAKMDASAVQTQVVEDLRALKELLSRGGLPRMYVEHKFKILSAITSQYLASLNSNFAVRRDPDHFLSFIFDRFDGHEEVTLPMDKLSGGQKVRLCISFLLAVQQELVSEVGFQTFDEPSTHLDREGVDSLCDIFIKLQELLGTSEHQLWVCDHHPSLEAAFSATYKLAS